MNLITLTDVASGSMVTVAPERGALVTSFRVGDRELLYLDAATLLDSSRNVRGGIPVLFPAPGKLEGDAWHYQDQSGVLRQHGFARNLPWTIVESDGACLSLVLSEDETTLPHYPWRFTAILRFVLSAARLRIGMKVKNRSDSAMPFALGYHPYFQVADKAGVRIDTAATRAFDNVLKRDVPFTGFDLTRDEVDLHLLDHGSNASALHVQGGSIEISASASFTRWIVWTVAGKEFVCLEPWTSPGNALNTGEGLIALDPGRVHESWIEISFR